MLTAAMHSVFQFQSVTYRYNSHPTMQCNHLPFDAVLYQSNCLPLVGMCIYLVAGSTVGLCT